MARSDRFALIAAFVAATACSIPPESEYVGGDAAADARGDAFMCSGKHLYWDSTSGHCYRFEPAQLSWASAESDCVVWGGHLVAINDADEQAFVSNIINSELPDAGNGAGAWIGLTTTITPPAYAWSTGEALTFVNWGGAAPTGKPCVFEYTAKLASHWDDFVCNVQASYVCER